MDSSLNTVILSFPSVLQFGTKLPDGSPLRSWNQLVKTGSFVSNRYGQFSITTEDLAQMLQNFNTVTPKPPTELPIDYDHLSMDPKKPGDGIAAGWLKQLEIRNNGTELWGEIEWTSDGAERIEKKEYRFVSPSFVKDHVHKDGTKIGATLLAAAITNHPFLEGMQALTLYSCAVMGDLATPVMRSAGDAANLAALGQRVSFLDNGGQTPELTTKERSMTFIVKATVGDGDDQFVRLSTLDGEEFGWFRSTQLAAARPASPQPIDAPRDSQEVKMSDPKAAARFEARVATLVKGRLSHRDAFSLAQREDSAGALAYRLAGVGAEELQPASTVVLLSAKPGESFDDVALRYAAEHNIPLRQAIKDVGRLRPDLAENR